MFNLRFLDGHTYRGCFAELDGDIQKTCMNDTFGKNCTVCENVNGVRGCNNNVSSCSSSKLGENLISQIFLRVFIGWN